MEQDDVGRGCVLFDVVGDALRGNGAPVAGIIVPQDDVVAIALGGFDRRFGEAAVRRPHHAADRGIVRVLPERRGGAVELAHHLVAVERLEIGRMGQGVVGDLVAGCRDPARQIRILPRIVADEEERRVHVRIGQDVEQQRRFDRIRSVVERQRDEPRAFRAVHRRPVVQKAVDARREARREQLVRVVGTQHDRGRHRLREMRNDFVRAADERDGGEQREGEQTLHSGVPHFTAEASCCGETL